MKKTSLRKNRFSTESARLPDDFPMRKLSRKPRSYRANSSSARLSLREMMMRQWDDSGIAELLGAGMGRPISPEAQAFYDHIDAVKAGKATWDEYEKPVVSEAA
ncbi:hypothetical protein F2P45_11880 [Massilia sp. CCM 8733]|uniref:Antitoxin VbhA domain-containing protein n=1 Tax=Massilia mucilaginosa TaxID=2609282 RepID=A0ABX0NSI8_9BURK|nr:hypothetical protein [Massilia mucilaginosa]NHZ89705.1 hypothetical protein [Massilia mucilaginosa]